MKLLKTMIGVMGLVLAFLSIGSWAFRGPAVSWQTYSEQLILEAKESDKPVIVIPAASIFKNKKLYCVGELI